MSEPDALIARLQEENERLRAELAALNREFDSFAYSVSHDLRAPLRTVDGFANIVQEDYGGRLDDEGRRLLGIVREGSQRMSRLIDELLNLSRLSRQPLKRQAVDLDALVRDVLAGVGGREIDIVVRLLGTADADPALLQRVFEHLVGNAVKFTRDVAEPRIEIGVTTGETPVYYVKDNGAGFDMRYAGKLFGVFQRLHSASEFEGVGIGLAIVQRVVVRHGGKVWGESTLGEGATFFFTLRPGGGQHGG